MVVLILFYPIFVLGHLFYELLSSLHSNYCVVIEQLRFHLLINEYQYLPIHPHSHYYHYYYYCCCFHCLKHLLTRLATNLVIVTVPVFVFVIVIEIVIVNLILSILLPQSIVHFLLTIAIQLFAVPMPFDTLLVVQKIYVDVFWEAYSLNHDSPIFFSSLVSPMVLHAPMLVQYFWLCLAPHIAYYAHFSIDLLIL